MTNQERAAEAMETHDLFHFTSGDGWMEPHEDVIRCACGEEFFSYIQTGDGSGDDDRDPNLLYRQHLTQALADAGLLMPELPTDATGMWASGEWPAGFNYPLGLGEWPAHAYAYAPGEIGISAPTTMSTDEAEALALAILAAVKSDRKHNKETINE